MPKKESLYALGSIVCVVAIGATVFYLVRANKPGDTSAASPVQSSLAQVAPSNQQQVAADAASPDENAVATTPSITPADAAQPGNGQRGNMPNIPAGSKPFFGQVASISGSTVTVTSMGRRGGGTGTDLTATNTAAAAPSTTTITITLTDSTVFSGGTKDAIVSGARLVGYGTVNADGSITATNVQINPTRPAGGSGGGWQGHGAQAPSTQQ